MKKLLLAFAILTLLATPNQAKAQGETNKFGIHILETEEITQAAKLVNSQGGDWGWVTIVLRINDLNQKKWQDFFDDCRRLHIIPLIRLATEIENNFWRKPTTTDIDQVSSFLSALNWPTKDQHIIVFNEPNHAKEWGGEINPAEYARILDYAANKFKGASKNFIVLNAGFDLAAGNSPETMDTLRYWLAMNQAVPNIFNRLDAWSSHSYPNPGFVGKPTDQGRKSITGYRWEANVLKNTFGTIKNLPIFITETGWPHQDISKLKTQNSKLSSFLNLEAVAEYTKTAFNTWLSDQQVQAVTPFVLNYHAAPLDIFSWLNQDGQDYPHCQAVRELPKTAWWPEQVESWEISSFDLPKFLPINSRYQGKITLKNTGQSIWGEKNFALASLSNFADDLVLPPKIKVEPEESYQFIFNITAPEWPKTASLSWKNLKRETTISFFNPSRLDSYRDNFWQKILALVKVWWYRKTPRQELEFSYQENYPQN